MQVVTRRNEGPFGCWTASECRPARLAGLVDFVWYSEGTTTFTGERIFPNGKVELIVNLGEPYRLVAGAGTRLLTSCVTGLQSGPIVIEGPTRHRVLGVRLRPGGAYALLARPMREVSDLTVDLRDLVGRAADELAGRCHEATSAGECLATAVAWVTERMARGPSVESPIAAAAACIERSAGAASITHLRDQTGLSKARLAGAFRAQIGFTPKLYARIVRFRRVLGMLQQGEGPLAEVALVAGYYDQPHMNAEFRALAGIAPRDFLAARYPTGDGSTAAELPS